MLEGTLETCSHLLGVSYPALSFYLSSHKFRHAHGCTHISSFIWLQRPIYFITWKFRQWSTEELVTSDRWNKPTYKYPKCPFCSTPCAGDGLCAQDQCLLSSSVCWRRTIIATPADQQLRATRAWLLLHQSSTSPVWCLPGSCDDGYWQAGSCLLLLCLCYLIYRPFVCVSLLCVMYFCCCCLPSAHHSVPVSRQIHLFVAMRETEVTALLLGCSS